MGETDSLNAAEYAYEKKAEGKLGVIKILLIALYVAFVALFFTFCYATKLIPLFAVCPIFLWILIFFTWPIVKFDILYTFEHGTLIFYKVFHGLKGRVRREITRVGVQNATRISPYTGERLEGRVLDLCSSTSASSLVFIEYKDESGVVSIVFDSIERINKLLCSFAKEAASELRAYVYSDK